MLDVMNGIMSISSCIILATLMVCSLIRGDAAASILFAILLAQYIPLALFNKYPARVLNGNVGSYITGAILGLAACQTGLYLELVVAALPYIINGLLILASTRGRALIGGRAVLERPIRCNAGILSPTLSTNCPLTLVRLVVLAGARTEPEVVNKVLLLFLVCSVVAVAATWLDAVLEI
jgi:UDP-N-acetylglucosamine--dolichyl-phosphate N-acetylglucosaminephosphotransferase